MWTPEKAQAALKAYGIDSELENTGGNIVVVTITRRDCVIVLSEDEIGLYRPAVWSGEDSSTDGSPERYREITDAPGQAYVAASWLA